MTETNDFWHVADVQFDGRGGRVTRVDTMTQINPNHAECFGALA